MEKSFFKLDLKAMEKPMDLIRAWNAEGFIDRLVRLNRPEVWTSTAGPRQGQKILQGPFVHNYQKFNSNTGWSDDELVWPRSCHASNEPLLVPQVWGAICAL
jgi:hypothetical protein